MFPVYTIDPTDQMNPIDPIHPGNPIDPMNPIDPIDPIIYAQSNPRPGVVLKKQSPLGAVFPNQPP